MRPPTMFQRRLLLIAFALAASLGVLAAQLYRVTAIQGDKWLADAESSLVAQRWVPTIRGRILDRKGRVLAVDRPAYNVLAEYPAINGEVAFEAAERRARETAGDLWLALGPAEREAAIREVLPDAERELEAAWDELAATLDVPREELRESRSEIIGRVQRVAMHVRSNWLAKQRAEFEARGSRGPEPTLAEVNRPVLEQVEPHIVAEGLDEGEAYAVRRLAERYTWLSVAPTGERDYPFSSVEVVVDRTTFPRPIRAEGGDFATVTAHGVATHVLGWLTDAKAEHVEASPLTAGDPKGYVPGDVVGAAGAELGYESTLRGTRGHTQWRKDTNETWTTEPIPGADLTLTLDVMLQARIQALFDPALGLAVVQGYQGQPHPDIQPVGTPLAGAAVVLDVETGEILAMVSAPSYTREQAADDPEWVYNNPAESPVTNRAIDKPYPPGSVVKPMILASAVSAGVHALNAPIQCTGKLFPQHPDTFRCWIYKDHGITHHGEHGGGLTGPEAIAASCNIYFYTLGNKLGPQRITEWYRKFGVERGFDLGIGAEFPGWVGRRTEKGDPIPLEQNEAVFMGMGQGPVAWTPLHAAHAYATLAREGVSITPRIVKSNKPVVRDLGINLAARDAALEGLRRVVLAEYQGTGSTVDWGDGQREPIVAMDGITIWGKTGTAQAPSIIVDPDGAGGSPGVTVRKGDHAWFGMMCAPKGSKPRYAVSVVVDYGGSGGRVAGPIANQILRALRAEGYL